MSNPILTKVFTATAVAIEGFLIVAAQAGGKVAVATGGTDKLLGVADSMGAPANGRLDVAQAGWSEVRCGGNVSFGDKLTANAAARAVKAVPVAGQTVHIIGVAQADAADGDIIPFQVAPGLLVTP